MLGILFTISDSLVRVSNCSFSVFALYRLIRRTSLSQIFISSFKILLWSLFFGHCSKKSNCDTARICCTIVSPLKLSLHWSVSLAKKHSHLIKVIFKVFKYLYSFTRLLSSLNIVGNKA